MSVTPAASRVRRAASISGAQAASAVAADRFANFGECSAGDAFQRRLFRPRRERDRLDLAVLMRRPASSAFRTTTESV